MRGGGRERPPVSVCSGANLVEDGVADTEDVHDDRVLQQGQEVVGHSLPEVEQEVLDLEAQQRGQGSRSGREQNVGGGGALTSSKFTLMALSRMHWQ